jgi:hypothetical protein
VGPTIGLDDTVDPTGTQTQTPLSLSLYSVAELIVLSWLLMNRCKIKVKVKLSP